VSSREHPAPSQRATPSTITTSPRAAFRHRAFTVIWIATVVSNIGTWMYNAAAGWLMVSLNGDALHGVAGPGREQPADVHVRTGRRRAGRHLRQAAVL
jgi:hypothetical protein